MYYSALMKHGVTYVNFRYITIETPKPFIEDLIFGTKLLFLLFILYLSLFFIAFFKRGRCSRVRERERERESAPLNLAADVS